MSRALLLLVVLAWGAGCDPCAPPDDSALDYGDPSSWACHPARGDGPCHDDLDATELTPDGAELSQPHVAAEEPELDCFYLYPTLDLATTPGVHTSFEQTWVYDETTRMQAARLTERCRLFAPHYRQVTIGSYARAPEEVEGCFETALGDVKLAFTAFLDEAAGERPFVLYGHSQGAQHSLSLLREVIAPDDELRARMLATLAIGWPFYLGEDGRDAFGSGVEPCASSSATGCVVSYRTFVDGQAAPLARAFRPEQTARVACTDPSAGGMLDAYARNPAGADEPFARYRDLYAAECQQDDDGNAALAVSYAPAAGDGRPDALRLEGGAYDGAVGAHLIDVQLTLGDLVRLVEDKALARASSGLPAD